MLGVWMLWPEYLYSNCCSGNKAFGVFFKQNNNHLFSCFPIKAFKIEMYWIAKYIWEKITWELQSALLGNICVHNGKQPRVVALRKFSRNTQYSSSGQAQGSPVKVLNEKLDSLPRDRNGTVTESKEKGLKDILLCSFFLLRFPLQRQNDAPTNSHRLASRELRATLPTAPADLSSCRQPKREKSYCQS